MNEFMGFDPEEDEVINHEVVPHAKATTERSTARRIALQALYELDTTSHAVGEVLNYHVPFQESKRVQNYTRRLVTGINLTRQKIDKVIQELAPDFPIDQIAVIDRNILRIAVLELAMELTPVGVAIDEAVELTKLFGAENSARFINGVLGSVADNIDVIQQYIEIPPELLNPED